MSAVQEIAAIGPHGTREWISRLFWEWYDLHLDEHISIKIWKLPVKIRVRQLRPVFERLFGSKPAPFDK